MKYCIYKIFLLYNIYVIIKQKNDRGERKSGKYIYRY